MRAAFATATATATALVALAAGCTSPAGPELSAPSPSGNASRSPSPAETSVEPSPSDPSATATRSSRPRRAPHPVSVPALFDKRYDGGRLRLGDAVVDVGPYTQYPVTYLGDGLVISGVMNIPDGRGPFPVLVLAHGYIDPAIYVTGQGLRREQDWLARAGYAVLHVDYRNHAGSDEDPRAEERLRLGYTVDLINAVKAVRRSTDRRFDGERIGLLGRSMGGGVVYNVLAVRPRLVDAAVVFAPVSSLAADNFNRWVREDPERAGVSQRILRAYGAPERNRRFWREASPRTYFDRVTEPVLIHHGTSDESCPVRWSHESLRALRGQGARARMYIYPGEPHAFIEAWPTSMRRTVAFFERHIE